MSKYKSLWEKISRHGEDNLQLTFAEIEHILGLPIDHSFLNFKKELLDYGWQVGKISLKAKTVNFSRCNEGKTKLTLPEHYKADALFFFDGKHDALTLYEALFAQLKSEFPVLSVKVQKSQISFYNRHLFAMVSLPRRKSETGILVSFGLGRKLDSPRIAIATEPYPNRWTHHVPVTDAAQLDAELLGWLREAYDFANSKSR